MARRLSLRLSDICARQGVPNDFGGGQKCSSLASARSKAGGFTLVELIVATASMVILTGMALAYLEGTKLAEVKAKANSPGFKQAFAIAAGETMSGAPGEKIDEMASVLAHSLLPVEEGQYTDDLASFVRDVIRLTEKDVQVLLAG